MACSDFQTECLRVVTIGYLKSFIGNDVQDSSNSSPIYISSAYADTYCPTYSELTGGSISKHGLGVLRQEVIGMESLLTKPGLVGVVAMLQTNLLTRETLDSNIQDSALYQLKELVTRILVNVVVLLD
jgi:hypothetical protein